MTTDFKPDQIHRFIFDDCHIRGEVITLNHTLHDATQHQNLPPSIQALLGEFLTAVSLMTEILKFSGTLTLQARGSGPVPLIMAEASDQRTLRGIAKIKEDYDGSFDGLTLPELIGQGVLSLTLDPTQGNRYQGIVALEGQTLADCLTQYFLQSEQLPTRLWIFSNGQQAGGLLLQALPASSESSLAQEKDETAPEADHWETAEHLANTVKPEELYELDHPTLLTRLFHEFDVRLFPPNKWSFKCPCSRDRSLQALTSLGRDDAQALLSERDIIEINCEFCGAAYRFGQTDLDELFHSPQHPLH